MHYRNGRPVELGDQVLLKDYSVYRTGYVVSRASGTACNLGVLCLGEINPRTAITAGECMLESDALGVTTYEPPETTSTPGTTTSGGV